MSEAGSAYCNDVNNWFNGDYNDRCVGLNSFDDFDAAWGSAAGAAKTALIVWIIIVVVVIIACVICCVCLCKYMAKSSKSKKSDSDKKEGGQLEITEV